MQNYGSAIASLTVGLESVQKSQEEAREFNMNSFKRIMEKLDLLAPMQTQMAVMTERVQHLNENFLAHVKTDEKLTERVTDLERESWIKRGIAVAVSGIVGFGASLLHRG